MTALAGFAAPASANQKVGRFEQRVVAILNAGGTASTVQGRLDRVGAEFPLTADQQVAVEGLRTLVRSRGQSKGLSLAEAEAFASRNPASPVSTMLVAEAALANDEPQRSADLLITAASQAGSLVHLISPVVVSKVTDALESLSDRRRTADLAQALVRAGWSRGSASLQSYLAMEAIRDELASGRLEQARQLLPAVKDPVSLHLILIDNRLAALRGEVEQLAGTRLEHAWREYLTRTRDEWIARGDLLSATAYASALKQANQYEALGSAFLARFMRGYNCPTDMVARSIAADLVESLAKMGRWTKAQDVMRRSGGVPPPTYAAMLLERGEFGRAASLLDRSIRAGRAPKNEDELKAQAWLQATHACAAYRSGNGRGSPFNPALLDVSARLFILLCLDRTTDARAALIAALADEGDRLDALRWAQPFAGPAVQSGFRKSMNLKIRTLQREPAVVEAAKRVGTILDWSVTSEVPAAGELTTSRTPKSWQCGQQHNWDLDTPEPETISVPYSQR